MSQRFGPCDPNRLRLLLNDALAPAQQAEVVGHLDACAGCQQALEGLAAEPLWWSELRHLNTPSGPPAPPPARSEPPRTAPAPAPADGPYLGFLDPAEDPAHLGRLGPFAITAVLGRGGMGIVLKAFDADLQRPVAIKVLAPHFASSGAARQRFAREARAAAAVVQEHVVAIHTVASWKGLPYLVMPYVGGRSLQERLDAEGPLDVPAVVRIGRQVAAGLAAAHAQGLVHRDVKPANILLENGVERVGITDFGLARAVDDAALTQSGIVAGTPQYMAPEQARGEPVDQRADLFSLGSTLFAMCTGVPPFRAESALAVLRRICDEPAPPVRALNPDVPAWLAALIERLHAKDPAGRFQSAAEVAELLGQCLAHLRQPDAVPLPSPLAPAPPRPAVPRRLRWAAAAGLVVAVGLVGGAALRWTPLGRRLIHVPTLEAPVTPSREFDRAATVAGTDAGLQAQLLEAHRRATALEADLRQPSGTRPTDLTDALLGEARHRLGALERDLGAAAPGAR